MAGKLIMTWDIAPDKEQEYFEFVVREFLPDVQRFGFTLSDAWVTVYGERPQIMVSAVMPSVKKVEQAMDSEKWQDMIDKLLGFVTNFNAKIVRAKGGFQF
jgi:hypothetical protein